MASTVSMSFYATIRPMQNPAILFDCDGTLSQIEGIVELARWKGVEKAVAELTEKAMGQIGMCPDIYRQRLALVKPSQHDLIRLGQTYYQTRAEDIDETINILAAKNFSVYVVSAGMNPSVKIFAEQLNIPNQNVFAVDLSFDQDNQYLDFDHTSPLTQNSGKRIIVAEIKKRHSYLAYVGDGMNDLQVKDLVDTFIGYGGIFYRQNIADECKYYIKEKSMKKILTCLCI